MSSGERLNADGERGLERARAPRRGTWQPFAAAAVVALLATGAVALLAGEPDRPDPTGPADAPSGSAPGSATRADRTPPAGERPGPVPLDRLLVRDGARVAASGRVLALPGRPVRFCAPAPVALPGYPAGEQPPPAYCELGVTLVGADLDRLADRTRRGGAVWGQARIEGRYDAGTVTVDRQGPPDDAARESPTVPERPPCAAPPGGWRRDGYDDAAVGRLQAHLDAHPDRYAGLAITYPDGPPSGPTDGPGYAVTQVVLVGTVLNPAAAERELRTVFAGNLCISPAPRSAAEIAGVERRLSALLPPGPAPSTRDQHGIYGYGPDQFAGRVRVELVVVDEAARRVLGEVDAGTGILEVRPWLRPLR